MGSARRGPVGPHRLPMLVGLVAAMVALAGLPPAASGAPPDRPSPSDRTDRQPLPPCDRLPRARCGSIKVPLDRRDPSLGTIRVAFEVYGRWDRSRPGLGTIVAVEGGPGYSTTGSRAYYRDLFRPLLDRRRLLLVDNRGTGKSEPIRCQPLQSYQGNYIENVGTCGRQLGPTSDVYGTAVAADDLAAVLDRLNIKTIDLYGDSYGTFFGQSFAVRHPERLRSLVLDSAYFVGGTDPFYTDTNRALRDAFTLACRRSPTCAQRPSSTMARIARLAHRLRDRPISGRAPNADGVVRKVTVDVGGLIYLVTAAATTPSIYRELDAAIRASLRTHAYHRPLLRIARETYLVGGGGPVRWWSEGLYVAVACNDYPLAFDRMAPIPERPAQYEASLDALRANRPQVFAPFTVTEWVTAPWEYFDICLKWPVPSRHIPPVPASPDYPDVPTLVLAGDLDSLTSPEGARDTAAAFPNSTYVEVKNMWHVTALGDYDRCTSLIVRRFVRSLYAGDTSCADRYNEMRLVDTFARDAVDLSWKGPRRRTARAAAATVGDVIARWYNMYGYSGVGLRGGTFTTTDGPRVRWHLRDVRWLRDIAVSGRAQWRRDTGQITAQVTVDGSGARPGRLLLRWNDWHRTATALATGRLAGRWVRFTFPAP